MLVGSIQHRILANGVVSQQEVVLAWGPDGYKQHTGSVVRPLGSCGFWKLNWDRSCGIPFAVAMCRASAAVWPLTGPKVLNLCRCSRQKHWRTFGLDKTARDMLDWGMAGPKIRFTMKMYCLLKMRIVQCHVSFQEQVRKSWWMNTCSNFLKSSNSPKNILKLRALKIRYNTPAKKRGDNKPHSHFASISRCCFFEFSPRSLGRSNPIWWLHIFANGLVQFNIQTPTRFILWIIWGEYFQGNISK